MNPTKPTVTSIPFIQDGLFECVPNVLDLAISGPYACYMCPKGFADKDTFDLHFQQQIPRDRVHDLTVEQMHLAHLPRIDQSILDVYIKRGASTTADSLVITNTHKYVLKFTHMYLINNETFVYRELDSCLAAGAKQTIKLDNGNLALAVTNTLVVRFCMYGVAYLEQHVLKTQCCGVGKNPSFKVDTREIDQQLYASSKSLQLRFPLRNQIRSGNKSCLTPKNYFEMIEKCTMLEHIEKQLGLDGYERRMHFKAEDIHNGNKLIIRIQDVQDMLPDLTRYDSIHIKLLNNVTSLKSSTLARTINIQKHYIIAVFDKRLMPGYYNMTFKTGTYPFNLEYFVLQRVVSFNIIPFLFPTREDIASKVGMPSQCQPLVWYNNDIKSNELQMQAVHKIVQGTAHPYPYILYGPPGTGKTKTLVEAICQIAKNKSTQILVCATSNAAADELAIRISRNLHSTCPFDHRVLRMYSRDYANFRKIDQELVSCSNYCLGGCLADLHKFQIIVATLMVAGGLHARINSAALLPEFTHIILDECSSATESTTLVPLVGAFANGAVKAHIVLAGDAKQLGPVILNINALNLGYDQSMFERLLNSPAYAKDPITGQHNANIMTKLVFNFRSHPAIIEPSNSMFYDNELSAIGPLERTHCFLNWHMLPKKSIPVVFHARINTHPTRELNSKSYFNFEEIQTILKYVKELLHKGINGRKIKQSDIGIITPYRKQVQKLEQAMKNRNWNEIVVSSIEMFQGKEKPIILASTVRSGRIGIGFLRNEKRLNVMLTRAQALMIVVGDPLVLQEDNRWRELMARWKRDRVCTGDQFEFGASTKSHLYSPELSFSDAVALLPISTDNDLTGEIFYI